MNSTCVVSISVCLTVLIIVRYLSFQGLSSDMRKVANNQSPRNYTPPFILNHSDGQHIITFNLLPRSFSNNCGLDTTDKSNLLVLVLSSTNNSDARNSIRKLWANPDNSRAVKDNKASVYFIVGDGNISLETLREEIDMYDDIIIIDVKDIYENLVYKVFSILHISDVLCPSSFTLKIDEDVVFNIDRFLDGTNLFFSPEKPAIYCRVWYGKRPLRVPSKWYVSTQQYSGETYPDFCNGLAYILTRGAAKMILNNTHHLPDIQIEDVLITGLISERAGVQRIGYQTMFEREEKFHQMCDNGSGPVKLLAQHKFKTYESMRIAWKRISSHYCP